MKNFNQYLSNILEEIKKDGLFKQERLLLSPQRVEIDIHEKNVINLCANNYLGLSDDPRIINASKEAMDNRGYGMSSVRFICGTQDLHKELEQNVSEYLDMEDTILFISCFDANGGVFEPLFTAEDAIISDTLNHASIIDGVRLCKAKRYRYKNNDMQDLERCLQEADSSRFKIVVTDGVFSMDGTFANLKEIKALCNQYESLLMVDDSHATGFIGPKGKGTSHLANIHPDIITSTFGKALGGGCGGFISSSKEVIQMLRQRSRPYLFSNSIPPGIVGGTLKGLALAREGDDLRKKLQDNSQYFRTHLSNLGYVLLDGQHPIIPIMIYDAIKAQQLAEKMYELGIYVTAFSFPVVPKGEARIRTQMTAGLQKHHLDKAIKAFHTAGKELHII